AFATTASDIAVASTSVTAPDDRTSSTVEVVAVEASPSTNASTTNVSVSHVATSTVTYDVAQPQLVAPAPVPALISDPVVAGDSMGQAPTIVTAPMPPRLVPCSYALPSLLAHIASDKFCDGLPLQRQEDRFARLGVTIHRSTMSRWLEEVGAIVGATIVE